MNDSVYVCARVHSTVTMFTLLCMKDKKYSQLSVYGVRVRVCVCVRVCDSADDGFSSGACGRWFFGQTR